MSLISTLQDDVKAGETFLVAEGEKILGLAEKGIPAVLAAFTTLVADAKGQAQTLVTAAQGPLANDISAIEADFETAIANLAQRLAGGDQSVQTLLTALGAAGVNDLAGVLESLVKPLVVKVLAGILPAAVAAVV